MGQSSKDKKDRPFHPMDIEGFISRREGVWLRAEARRGIVIEIGSFKGRSTTFLAGNAIHVFCCEPFLGQPILPQKGTLVDFATVRARWMENTREYRDAGRVTLLEMRSKEAFPWLLQRNIRGASLVFVDGSHYSDDLRNDVRFATLLARGGIIAFHDYHGTAFPDVRKVVDSWFCTFGHQIEEVPAPGSIKAFRLLHCISIPDEWDIQQPERRETCYDVL